ncbi:MAG: hypothetical protein R3A52_24985 [Polyangiales bacterium]
MEGVVIVDETEGGVAVDDSFERLGLDLDRACALAEPQATLLVAEEQRLRQDAPTR